MSGIVQRFIRDNISPEQGWRLIDWCIERGGDEFSFRMMELGASHSSHEPLSDALRSFHRGTPRRDHMVTLAGEESRRPTDTWSPSTESASVLRRHIAGGLFVAPSYSDAGWLEDFMIYRRGEVMLGVVSHEGLVVLRLTAQEHAEFRKLKIESYETAT